MKFTVTAIFSADPRIQLEAEPTDSIKDIKAKIEEIRGYEVERHKILTKGGFACEDEKTLEDYDIVEGSALLFLWQRCLGCEEKRKKKS